MGLFTVWMLSSNDGIQFNLMFTLFNYDVILTVILLKLIVITLISCRWLMVLNCNNIYQSFIDSLKFVLIGHSLMMVIPGIIGQDMVKIAGTIHASRSSGRNMEIVSLAVLDRLIGVMSLFLSSAIFILAYISFESIDIYSSSLHKLMILTLFFSIFFIAILIFIYILLKRIKKTSFSYEKINIVFSKVLRIIDQLDAINNKAMLVYISIVSHVVNALILIVIVKEFHNEIHLLLNMIFGLISNFGNLFPFTPGGLGVTESIFMYLYSFIDYGNGVTIGVSFRLLSYTSFIVLTLVIVPTSYLWKYKLKKFKIVL